VWPVLQVHGGSEADATSISSGVGVQRREGGRQQQTQQEKTT